MAKKEKTIKDDILSIVGEGAVIQDFNKRIEPIPTGSLALDVSIGIGGIPKGRFTEIYGLEAGGKTTLALSIIRQALKTKAIDRVLYVDTENNLNNTYVRNILDGLDLDDSIFVQPKSAEDAFEISLRGIAEDVPLIVFDSIGSLSPKKELESDFGSQSVGQVPKIVSQFLRMSVFDVRDKGISFIFINQVRDIIGSYVGGLTTPAGHALKHFLSLRLFVKKGKDIMEKGDVIGNLVDFSIKKNKVGTPFRSAFTNNIYGKGIEYERDVLNFATMLGIVRSRGSYFAFKDEIIGSKPGVTNTAEFLRENETCLDEIVKMCYNTANVELPEYCQNGEVK